MLNKSLLLWDATANANATFTGSSQVRKIWTTSFVCMGRRSSKIARRKVTLLSTLLNLIGFDVHATCSMKIPSHGFP